MSGVVALALLAAASSAAHGHLSMYLVMVRINQASSISRLAAWRSPLLALKHGLAPSLVVTLRTRAVACILYAGSSGTLYK